MRKEEFTQQLNELVPRPDPATTEALYRFSQECEEADGPDMVTAFRVVARNFSRETMQGAYEIIQHQNAALPSELFAAAVYLQAGYTPAEVSKMAYKGALMGFFGPDTPEEPSQAAVCTVVEAGQIQQFYTMHFGEYHPQQALEKAMEESCQRGISTAQALAHLSVDDFTFGGSADGLRRILTGGDSKLTDALFQIRQSCPAVAAHITYDVEKGAADVTYNPLWLELRQGMSQDQAFMQMSL